MRKSDWKNRIVGHGSKPASAFTLNELNWRRHPESQQQAIDAVLSQVGWVTGVIVNVTTGNLIDGHLRIERALEQGDNTPVPFTEVKLTEAEEQKVLAVLDPIGGMAETDEHALAKLLDLAGIEDEALLAAIETCSEQLPDVEGLGEDFTLPDGDREPFQQLTFTVTDAQAEVLKAALQKAKDAGLFVSTGNENSNGNALARIAEAYV